MNRTKISHHPSQDLLAFLSKLNQNFSLSSHLCRHIYGPPYAAFPGDSVVKESRFKPWVGKIPWRRKMATHSSILAWEIPWTEELGGLQSVGSQESDTTEHTHTHTHTHTLKLKMFMLLSIGLNPRHELKSSQIWNLLQVSQ